MCFDGVSVEAIMFYPTLLSVFAARLGQWLYAEDEFD